jgi:enoyl-CoA hydratase
MSEGVILIERSGPVGIVRLNRPKQLNALNDELMNKLGQALVELEADGDIRCIVITGGPKVFAAGADIGEMKDFSYSEAFNSNFISRNWETILKIRKPVIAAVSGFALGGGCELAMMCDLIVASESAKFGQPEIKLGIIPGAGGTQRLPRTLSKYKAMDMVLTGKMIDAVEAEKSGLVSRILPLERFEDEVIELAEVVASRSLPSLMAAKESINRAYESTLSEGLLFERRQFHSMFATCDQKEGMAAFVEKRSPDFQHR